MNRADFFKILGITALAPSVIIQRTAVEEPVSLEKFNPKRWPIYPEVISFSMQNRNYLEHTFFSYVKINRHWVYYLIPVKECGIGGMDNVESRFKNTIDQVDKEFVVDKGNQFMFDMGFIIKYDPKIHHD